MNLNPSRGTTFVRVIKSLGVAKGDAGAAVAFAESQDWSNVADVVQSIQASAVTATGTADVAPPTPASFDLAEFVRPMTILGKLTGLRRVPARVRLISAAAGSTGYWSGEATPRPISRLTFEGETLEALSVVAMVVTTLELLASSAPSAESILSRDLANAIVQAMDGAFIDAQNLGIAGVKPAAITAGVTAVSLSKLRGSRGTPAFPLMTARGGTLFGLPAINSAAVPRDLGSPGLAAGTITLLDCGQILVCDDGGGALEIGKQASLQMSDGPGSGAQQLVRLWQTHAAALKMTRYANWVRVRDGAAQVLDQVAY